MEVRATQYRAAFLDEARLTATEQGAFDTAIADLNRTLAAEAQRATALIGQIGDPASVRPRAVADIAAGLLDAYRRSDDALRAALSPGARAAMERTRFDLLTQVDLEVFRTLGEALEQRRGAVAPASAPGTVP
jgi:hypothetical protein